MRIGINLATENLRRGIERAINGSGCPPCVVRAVLESMLAMAREAEQQEINREAEQYRHDLEMEQKAAQDAAQAADGAGGEEGGEHPAAGEDAREGPQNG